MSLHIYSYSSNFHLNHVVVVQVVHEAHRIYQVLVLQVARYQLWWALWVGSRNHIDLSET